MVHIPREAQFLLTLLRVKRASKQRWRNEEGTRLYEWDELHGELEVYNNRGRHLGAVDPDTGALLKGPVKGRTIDV